jgi:hypothetical protein
MQINVIVEIVKPENVHSYNHVHACISTFKIREHCYFPNFKSHTEHVNKDARRCNNACTRNGHIYKKLFEVVIEIFSDRAALRCPPST